MKVFKYDVDHNGTPGKPGEPRKSSLYKKGTECPPELLKHMEKHGHVEEYTPPAPLREPTVAELEAQLAAAKAKAKAAEAEAAAKAKAETK